MKFNRLSRKTVTNAIVKKVEEKNKVNLVDNGKIQKGVTNYYPIDGAVIAGDKVAKIYKIEEIDKLLYDKEHIKFDSSFIYGAFDIDGNIYLSCDLVPVLVDGIEFAMIKDSETIVPLDNLMPVEICKPNILYPTSDIIGVQNGRYVAGKGGAELVTEIANCRVISLRKTLMKRIITDNFSVYILLSDDRYILDPQLGATSPLRVISSDVDETIDYEFDLDVDRVPRPFLYLAKFLNGKVFKVAKSFKSTLSGYAKQIQDGSMSLNTLGSLENILRVNFSISPTDVLDEIDENYIHIKLPVRDKLNEVVYSLLNEDEYQTLIKGINVPAGLFGVDNIVRHIASKSITNQDINILKEIINK